MDDEKTQQVTCLPFQIPFKNPSLKVERDNWVIGEGGLIMDRVGVRIYSSAVEGLFSPGLASPGMCPNQTPDYLVPD